MYSPRKQAGLAAAAIVILLVLGLVALILGARSFNAELGLDQRETTEANMRRLTESLANYASLNLRLPCPAHGTSDTGTEDPVGPSATCNSPDGVVPWATLGIRRADALDGWGRKISYRVFAGASGLTQLDGASMVNCNASLGAPIDATLDANGLCKGPVGAPPGGSPPPNTPAQFLTLPARGTMLVVEDKGTTRTGNAFVLISHGESGNGAFVAEAPSGRTQGPDAAGKEIVNTQSAGTYWIQPRSAPGVQPNAAAHFDDVVEFMSFTDLVAKAKLEARSWSGYPLGARFSQPAVAAAAPGLSGENTGQTSLQMGGFLITGTDSSGTARNLGIRTEDSITGLGVIGGGSSAGDLNSALGERVTFQLGSGSQFQKMDIALNRFRVVGLSPTRLEERAEVSFWRGGDLLQTSTLTSWVEPVAPARCLLGLVSGAVFDRMDIRPIPRTGDGAQTTFTVAEIKACSEATASCTTAVANALDCLARPPSAAATPVQSVTATTATLRGAAHDNGASTTVSFDYGTTCSYPSSVAASPGSLSAGAGNTTVTASITGLSCNTSYYFRTRAVSAGGTTLGNDALFKTAACASPRPIATTAAPSSITTTSATLNGLVDDNGATTTVTFDYGTSLCYGFSTAATPGTVAGGAGATAVSATLTGLACNTRYHYRVRAVNSDGTTTAGDQAFTTAPCP